MNPRHSMTDTDTPAERAIRTKLEKRIGAIPDAVWTGLKQKGEVNEVLNFPDRSDVFRTLCRIAREDREQLAPRPRKCSPGRLADRELSQLLRPEELDAADAISVWAESSAKRDDRVQWYRAEFLGAPLTDEQANELLRSAAACYLPLAWFRDNRIPLVGHRSRKHNTPAHNPEIVPTGVNLWIEWPGGEIPDFRVDLDPDRFIETMEGPPEQRYLYFPDTYYADQQGGWVRIYPGSVLAELADVSQHLSRTLGWQLADATWFVLTGRVQPALPVVAEINWKLRGRRVHPVISLTIDVNTSAESVGRIYRYAQRQTLARDKRQLTTLDLFRFVVERVGPEPIRPNWPDLHKEWNRTEQQRWEAEEREWKAGAPKVPARVYPDAREFMRAFRRVERLLLGVTSGAYFNPALPLLTDAARRFTKIPAEMYLDIPPSLTGPE